MNNTCLSLEQEFALKFLSIQIHHDTNVIKLQNELINLFEKILIKHQNLQDVYSSSRGHNENITLYSGDVQSFISGLETEATMFYACVNSIKSIYDPNTLQTLLIEAIEISMMQKNYSDFISQYYAEVT